MKFREGETLEWVRRQRAETIAVFQGLLKLDLSASTAMQCANVVEALRQDLLKIETRLRQQPDRDGEAEVTT